VLDRGVELIQIRLDAAVTVPTHDLRRDLVAERVGQKRRMTCALPDAIAHDAVRVHIPSFVDDEPEVLLGGQAHHHAPPVPRGGGDGAGAAGIRPSALVGAKPGCRGTTEPMSSNCASYNGSVRRMDPAPNSAWLIRSFPRLVLCGLTAEPSLHMSFARGASITP